MSRQIDFNKLSVVVKDYQKLVDERINVVFTVLYEGESTEINALIEKPNQNENQNQIVRRAFRSTRKEIKEFIQAILIQPSIIGTNISFNISEFNDV